MFMEMFEMANNYNSRKVGRFDADWGFVSTAYVTDASKPYETAVKHRDYNNGLMVIVEPYDTKEEAEVGHARWVQTMTTEPLPDQLVDRGLSGVSELVDVFDDENWRVFPRSAESTSNHSKGKVGR